MYCIYVYIYIYIYAYMCIRAHLYIGRDRQKGPTPET